ncbi:MAG: hypothetical protein EZS28_013374 [Streblomastix strix]|uniref:Uncharacterized protein n=1 Tax=Streblomastix strix TaxID=222440 RepID=A0A5J4W9Q2_9EUKA|nr:MAG: hypothetical protein EZS28_013374 [Streblomastix strix]
MFKSTFFQGITKVNWYSDGGPHFRNQQIILALLRTDTLLIPNVQFHINFSEPYHGKGEVDSLFGRYQKEIDRNKGEQGIQSLETLQERLSHSSLLISLQHNDCDSIHDVVIHDVESLPDDIEEGDDIYAQHLTNDRTNERYKIPLKIKHREGKETPKRSSAPVINSDIYQ